MKCLIVCKIKICNNKKKTHRHYIIKDGLIFWPSNSVCDLASAYLFYMRISLFRVMCQYMYTQPHIGIKIPFQHGLDKPYNRLRQIQRPKNIYLEPKIYDNYKICSNIVEIIL